MKSSFEFFKYFKSRNIFFDGFIFLRNFSVEITDGPYVKAVISRKNVDFLRKLQFLFFLKRTYIYLPNKMEKPGKNYAMFAK